MLLGRLILLVVTLVHGQGTRVAQLGRRPAGLVESHVDLRHRRGLLHLPLVVLLRRRICLVLHHRRRLIEARHRRQLLHALRDEGRLPEHVLLGLVAGLWRGRQPPEVRLVRLVGWRLLLRLEARGMRGRAILLLPEDVLAHWLHRRRPLRLSHHIHPSSHLHLRCHLEVILPCPVGYWPPSLSP